MAEKRLFPNPMDGCIRHGLIEYTYTGFNGEIRTETVEILIMERTPLYVKKGPQ